MCGTLQCKDFSRNLSYYEQYYMIGEKYFTDGVTNETCHTVIFDFGLDTQDPGFVPSGASCGPGKASFFFIVYEVNHSLVQSFEKSGRRRHFSPNFVELLLYYSIDLSFHCSVGYRELVL